MTQNNIKILLLLVLVGLIHSEIITTLKQTQNPTPEIAQNPRAKYYDLMRKKFTPPKQAQNVQFETQNDQKTAEKVKSNSKGQYIYGDFGSQVDSNLWEQPGSFSDSPNMKGQYIYGDFGSQVDSNLWEQPSSFSDSPNMKGQYIYGDFGSQVDSNLWQQPGSFSDSPNMKGQYIYGDFGSQVDSNLWEQPGSFSDSPNMKGDSNVEQKPTEQTQEAKEKVTKEDLKQYLTLRAKLLRAGFFK